MTLATHPFTAPAETTRSLANTLYQKFEVFEADTGGGVSAPWWADVAIERVATTDGRPLPQAFVDEYMRLFDALSDLEFDGEVEPGAVARARKLLQRAMFSGAMPPALSWHGGDAIVFFWTAHKTTNFFTITSEGFSRLKECDGVITGRTDDLPFANWDYLFPLPHGIH